MSLLQKTRKVECIIVCHVCLHKCVNVGLRVKKRYYFCVFDSNAVIQPVKPATTSHFPSNMSVYELLDSCCLLNKEILEERQTINHDHITKVQGNC